MKKVILSVLFIALGTVTMAQTKEVHEEKKEKKVVVPDAVTTAFAKEFPNKKVKWDMEDGAYEAEFKIDGIDASAVYDKKGHRRALEIAIKATELPAAATEYIAQNYAAYKLTETAKITDDKNTVTYEAEIGKDGKSWDVIFDAKGKFIKQKFAD